MNLPSTFTIFGNTVTIETEEKEMVFAKSDIAIIRLTLDFQLQEGKKKMNKELLEALNILEKEKEISKETLFEAIENSLLTACKNHFGKAAVL